MASKFSHAMLSVIAVALAITLAMARAIAAQCPDGILAVPGRPCGSAPPPVVIDPRRIAVLPFRTTGVDPDLELGKGLADLIAAEFNGAVGPAAVEVGEVLRAWNRAGGDKEPLTQKQAVQIARSLGAGQLVWGSVVGTGRKVMATASILNVPDGAVRVAPVQIAGSEDSLPVLTTALATQLLGRGAGVTGAVSNDAVRAYFAGLVAYHATKPVLAEAHFLRAANFDSTFVLPTYRLVLLRALTGPSLGVAKFSSSFRYLWKHRQLLSDEQRVLLQALADSTDLLFRAQALPRMERAMVALPNSAEAWDILGNMYLHVGALIGRDNWEELARQAFLKALQLDASLCLCSSDGLAQLAYVDGDAKSFEKYAPDLPWHRYLRALLKRDGARIRTARILYARELAVETNGPGLVNGSLPPWLTGIPLPQPEVDSLLVILDALANDARQRSTLALWTMMTAHFAGQPSRAAAAARFIPRKDSAAYYANVVEFGYADSAAAERLSSLVNARDLENCEVALSRVRRGDTTGAAGALSALNPADQSVDEIVARMPPRAISLPTICAHVLRGVLTSRQRSGAPLLLRADSLMRYMPRNCCDRWNYDLGIAFARRGEYAMAAAAVRRHARVIGTWALPRLVMSLRDEGRWAALAGDTTAAIKAYKQYLTYRENPEPVLVPERDSVRAERQSLEQAQRRRRAP